MANTNTKTGTRRTQTSTSSKTAEKKTQTKEVDPEEEKPIVPKEIDPEMYVTVYNGFQGRLLYKSSRTGEKFVWPEYGAEQEMQLRELRNAKNAHKKFFINNWFLFEDPWIIDYLGMKQYYKNAFGVNNFDDIFELPVGELKKTLKEMSAGQKKSVAYRATTLIADGQIDSRKTIAALEEALGIELTEK